MGKACNAPGAPSFENSLTRRFRRRQGEREYRSDFFSKNRQGFREQHQLVRRRSGRTWVEVDSGRFTGGGAAAKRNTLSSNQEAFKLDIMVRAPLEA